MLAESVSYLKRLNIYHTVVSAENVKNAMFSACKLNTIALCTQTDHRTYKPYKIQALPTVTQNIKLVSRKEAISEWVGGRWGGGGGARSCPYSEAEREFLSYRLYTSPEA